MTLFARRDGASNRRVGASAPRDWESTRLNSLALPKLVEPLVSRFAKSYSVLDLGPASPPNLDFFLTRGAKITVADFLPASGDSVPDLVHAEPGAHFDVVLAWDFLNYLKRDRLGSLIESLEPYFRPGTAIHAFIVTSRDMPSSPRRYRIENEKTLLCEGPKERATPAPRYVEQDLLKSMPGLNVEHRFQLRNGMLEYLFSYRTRLRVAYSASLSVKESPRSRSGSGSHWRSSPSR